CRVWSEGKTTMLDGLRDGLAAGAPVCRAHLTGSENVGIAAARDAWQWQMPDAYSRCARIRAELLDQHNPVRRSVLHPYPPPPRPRALDQAAGILAAVVALGRWAQNDRTGAIEAGADAAARLQAAVGFDATARPGFARALVPPNSHPLAELWAGVAERLDGHHPHRLLRFP